MTKTFISCVLLSASLISCVSKKKYAALEAELNTAKTRTEIAEVNKTSEVKTAEEYESAMADMQEEMNDMFNRMELAMQSYEAASGKPFDPTNAQQIMEEHQREQEDPSAGEAAVPMMNELHKQETRMRFTKQAFEKVVKNYPASQMKLVQKGGRLVISISKDILFSGDEVELSPSGETAVNRLAAAFKVQNDFRVLVMGVSDGEKTAAQATRAFNLAKAIEMREEVLGRNLLPSATTCAESYGDFKSCDRFDIVLEQNYEAAVNTLRYQPKY